MEKQRIRGKDLKKWVESISDDAYIYVDTYDNEHHKEFIRTEDYDENGKSCDKELLVVSMNKNKGEFEQNEEDD